MNRAKSILCAAMILASAAAGAQEFGFQPVAANLFVPWLQYEPLASGPFPAENWFWGGSAWWTERIGEQFTFETRWVLDPILRSALYMTVTFDTGFARMTVGPFLGLFNNAAVPLKSGLATRVRLEWPAVAFVVVGADTSIGAGVVTPGDFTQEASLISGGFYFPNVIVTLSMTSKRYIEMVSDTLTTTDSSVRWALVAEIFKKNSPFSLLCSMGWESIAKTWDDGTRATDELGYVFAGMETRIDALVGLDVSLGMEAVIFAVGLQGLAGQSPAADSFLFKAWFGFTVDLGEIRDAPTALPPPPPPATTGEQATDVPATDVEEVEEITEPGDQGPLTDELAAILHQLYLSLGGK